jgi:hypothetical protein
MAAKPLCPWCGVELSGRLLKDWAETFYTGAITLIACPNCRRVLEPATVHDDAGSRTRPAGIGLAEGEPILDSTLRTGGARR